MQPPPATPCPPGGPTIPDDVLEAVAAHFHALGEPTRLALLQWLAQGEHTVGDLRGQSAWYRCADASVGALCDGVCSHLARLAQRQRVFGPN